MIYREIAEADDAKREAEAKKITEGHYRTKRRGMDFFSDEEDDDERGGKRRKWSKKERRKRRLDREDGLEKLGESSRQRGFMAVADMSRRRRGECVLADLQRRPGKRRRLYGRGGRAYARSDAIAYARVPAKDRERYLGHASPACETQQGGLFIFTACRPPAHCAVAW